MPRYTTLKKKFERIDIGSMNSRITINVRNLEPPKFGGISFTENFTKKIDIWAMIETVEGVTIFDKSNIERVITHKFHIRKIPQSITAEDWIEYGSEEYGNNIYDVFRVENLGQEGRFLTLLSSIRGEKDVTANYS